MAEHADIRLIACPWPLSIEKDRIDRMVPAGATVANYIRELGWNPDRLSARVMIDGKLVEQAYWEHVRPKAGHALVIRIIPRGGENGKTALRIVGIIATVVASAWISGGGLAPLFGGALFAQGTVGATILAAGAAIGLTLALNAPVPPTLPRRALPGESLDRRRLL